MECHLCSTSCANVDLYLKHCKTHNSQTYACPECLIGTSSRTEFYRHFESHSKVSNAPEQNDEESFSCSHCHEDFRSTETFLEHVKGLYPSILVNCPCCSKRKIGTWAAFRKHFNSAHANTVTSNQQETHYDDYVASARAEDDSDLDNSVTVDFQETLLPSTSQSNSPKDSVECLTLRQEKEGMKTKLVTEISKIRVHHGVPNIALDKLFTVLSEAASNSKQLAIKFLNKNPRNEENLASQSCTEIAKSFSENDVLHQLLVNGSLDTYEKRKTVMKKTLLLVDDQDLYLGQNNAGEDCYIAYNPPGEIIKRQFQDATIQKSNKNFTKEFHESQLNGKQFYGDFFSSQLFKDIQDTLSMEERIRCNSLPIIIGLYRYVFMLFELVIFL